MKGPNFVRDASEIPDGFAVSRRFGVWQPDLRVCDDFLRSGINSGARIETPVRLATVDSFMASAVEASSRCAGAMSLRSLFPY